MSENTKKGNGELTYREKLNTTINNRLLNRR